MASSSESLLATPKRGRTFARLAELFQPRPRLSPDQWAAENRVYPDTAGRPGQRDPYLTPYAVAFARAFDGTNAKRVVLAMGAQSGKTEAVLDIIGWKTDTRPAPILYVGPSADFCGDQFEPRLMELFDQAKSLKSKLLGGKKSKKSLKRIAGIRIRLAHAGSSTALKSDPAAIALVDEYDEMLRNIRGQGDPLGLVEARGFTYSDFACGIVSTPSQGAVDTFVCETTGLEFWEVADPDVVNSPIWKLWQSGTRYHWAWRCPACSGYFIPRFKDLRWPEEARTPLAARRAAFILCPRPDCGGVIEGDEDGAIQQELNRTGVFVAPGQTITEDGEVVGDPPDSSTLSFWVSGLASPFVPWGERAEAYLTAVQSGETDKIQTAINAGFGECYAPAGGEAPEWTQVAALRMPYVFRHVPEKVAFLTAGVDVQKRGLFYVVRGWGEHASSWLIEHGFIPGETEFEAPWYQLNDLLAQTFDGLPIRRAFVDSGFRPGKKETVPENMVYEFCRQNRIAFPTKGYDKRNTPFSVSRIDVKGDGRRSAYGLDLVLLDTDYFKSWIHTRVRWDASLPGAWLLAQDATDDYCQQIVSEAREKRASGKVKWHATGGRANHYLDCEAMAYAAAFMVGIQRMSPDAFREMLAEREAERMMRERVASGQPANPANPASNRRPDWLGARRGSWF